MQYLNWIADNIVLVTAIQQGLFAALSAVFQLTGWVVASKWCGTLSTLDLGRVVRYFTAQTAAAKADQRVAKIEQAIGKESLKGTLGSLLVLLAISGCAGTFNEAKLAGVKARTATPPVTVSSPERCQSLSERQYWFTGLGLASGAIGAAAGGMTIPIESKTVDTVLIVTTVAGGVGAAGLGWFGAAAGADYVRECQ